MRNKWGEGEGGEEVERAGGRGVASVRLKVVEFEVILIASPIVEMICEFHLLKFIAH